MDWIPPNKSINKWFLLSGFICLLLSVQVSAAEFIQLPGVIHLHTTFSSGSYSLDELVEKAKQKGVEVLIPTDHDLVAMEYGIFPFRNLIKKREERKSILKSGPESYLLSISDLNKKQKDVLVIPGAQSSPFYYWIGNPFKGNLTAHNYRKELLIIGMKTPEDYRHLPLLHNGYSTRYFSNLIPQSIVFLGAFLFALILVFQKGIVRVLGVVVSLFSLAQLYNQHPFQSSKFDPYHGDQGIAPFQELIDYARDRKGLVFWAHPESTYAKDGVQAGPVKLKTPPYPAALLDSNNYTGFAALYGDNITAIDPGKQWDQTLIEFCTDKRERPPWAIAESDFHLEEAGVELDTFLTVFLVKEKSVSDILEALAKGRTYALQKENRGTRLSLDVFTIKDGRSGDTAHLGSGVKINVSPVISLKISAADNGQYPIEVFVNRGGRILEVLKGTTPLSAEFEDKENWNGKTFYRIDARAGGAGRLVSNPIFTMRGKTR